MPPSPKPTLSENHRRVVSVLLQQAERTCGAIERWLEQPSGSLVRVSAELSPETAGEVRQLLTEARREIERDAAELDLAAAVISRRRAILALLTKMLTDLEEVESPALRAYGKISPQAERQVDACLSRLHAVFERMAQLCVKA